MKKKIIQLFFSMLLVMFYASCSNEILTEENTEGIRLHISSGTKTRASVDPGTDDENHIDSIAIWFFKKGATDSDAPLLYYSQKVDANSGVDVTFTNSRLEGAKMSSDGTYDIYAVALDRLSSVSGISNLKELKEIVYKTDYSWDDLGIDGRPSSPFIMSGCLLEHKFENNHSAVIALVRLAVRLHITLTNETGYGALGVDEMTIINDAKNVGLFIPVEGNSIESFSDTEKKYCEPISDNEYTVYVNEYLGSSPVTIKISGTLGSGVYKWVIPIKYDGSTLLFRNTSYELGIRLRPYSAEITTQTSLDWDEAFDEEQTLDKKD